MTILVLILQVGALLNAAALAVVVVDILFGEDIYSALGADRHQQLIMVALLSAIAFALYLAGTA